MDDRVIRIATIGTSTIVSTFVGAASAVPEVAIATAYSRDAERGERFARANGIPAVSTDLAALLASGEVDAVYVASPNGIHERQARQAIEAGVHVLLEKPVTPTAAEFAALVDLARERGVVVLEAMRSAYDPAYEAIADALSRLGRIRRASLGYCQRSARYDLVLAGETPNIFDPALSGGALSDLGVYCASAMVRLFGEPSRIAGALVPIATGADGAGAALAVYDGFVVDLSFSKISASARPCEIQGELGTLVFDHVGQPTLVELALFDGTTERFEFPKRPSNMVHEIRRFAELLRGGGGAAADNARTLATMRVVEAIRASAAEE